MSGNQFTHLHVHTQYSLLDGASKPAELIAYAKEQGMDSIAITDHGNMYGAIEFYQEARKQGIKPVIGCEVYLAVPGRMQKNDAAARYHLILLAENNTGYHNLAKLVSISYLEGFYRKPRIDKDLLRQYHEGIICLSACIAGEVPRKILQNDMDGARRVVREYIAIFGKENFFLEMQNHDLPQERQVNAQLRVLSAELGVKLVITNDIHYVRKQDAAAQDVLLCIQTNKTVDDPGRMRFNNDSYYCKNYEEMLQAFPGDEEILANTHDIAERCNVDFTFGKLLLPEFPIPEQYRGNADDYVRAICEGELHRRYDATVNLLPTQEERDAKWKTIRERLNYELGIIKTMGYSGYFLIVWDFINFCRNVKPEPIPVGPGRGSAAGSIVAYLMHITNIEPLGFDLLFERFLNPERVSMPDIDTDFCYKRRDEVLEYVIHKYGPERVALIVTFGTLQARAAVRDVGRALGVPLPEVDRVAKTVPRELGITLGKALESSADFRRLYESDERIHKMIDIARSVEGLPRNTGTHAAGVVISPRPLIDYVPLQMGEPDSQGGDTVTATRMITTQYDKDKVEQLGLLKMDFLGLRTLTVLSDTLRFVRQTTGECVDLDNLPLDDSLTCRMLAAGDTQGVFQLESAGMTRLVVELGPTSMQDLVPLVALYRPGPLGSGMAEDFINGRHGRRTAESMDPAIDSILDETYGVILYQEQVMRIATTLAGFTLGEADNMRRAMGKKKAALLDSMKGKFVEGALRLHGTSKEKAEHIFGLLQHFAGYGFNKSHSVAYALVAYQTAYLKAHYPAEFFAALLSSIVSDSEKLSWYLAVCRERGLSLLPPDVNYSQHDFSVESYKDDAGIERRAIRFGLFGIKNVGNAPIDDIIRAREVGGPFTDLTDLCRRVSAKGLNKRVLENLIKCGACDSFGAKRSQLLAVYDQAIELGQAYQRDAASGQGNLFGEDEFGAVNVVKLPEKDELPHAQLLKYEKDLMGFYATGHPLDMFRKSLAGLRPIVQLNASDDDTYTAAVAGGARDGSFERIGGIITECRIRVTKHGDTMATFWLEDFTGKIQVVVFPKTYALCSRLLAEDMVVMVSGRFSVDERERKINAQQVVPLPGDDVHLQEGTGGNRKIIAREEAPEYYDANLTERSWSNKTERAVKKEFSASGETGILPRQAGSSAVLKLIIDKEHDNRSTQQALLALLPLHHGYNMTFLYLKATGRVIRCAHRFYVNAADSELYKNLQALLGNENVIIQNM